MEIPEAVKLVLALVVCTLAVGLFGPRVTRFIRGFKGSSSINAEDRRRAQDAEADLDSDFWDPTLGPMGLPREERDFAGEIVLHQPPDGEADLPLRG